MVKDLVMRSAQALARQDLFIVIRCIVQRGQQVAGARQRRVKGAASVCDFLSQNTMDFLFLSHLILDLLRHTGLSSFAATPPAAVSFSALQPTLFRRQKRRRAVRFLCQLADTPYPAFHGSSHHIFNLLAVKSSVALVASAVLFIFLSRHHSFARLYENTTTPGLLCTHFIHFLFYHHREIGAFLFQQLYSSGRLHSRLCIAKHRLTARRRHVATKTR